MAFSRATNKWRVKITGLAADVTVDELSIQFEHTSDLITIPKSRTNPSTRYALINGFESKNEARKFVSEWNEAFKRARSKMRCEVDETEDALMDDDFNTIIDSNDEDDDHDSRTKTRYRESKYDRQPKKHIECRHGDRCYSVDCPYKHSSAWQPCKSGIQCKDYDCTASHSTHRKGPCKHGRNCSISDCPYLHPKRNRVQESSNRARNHTLKTIDIRMTERRSAQLPIFASYIEFQERLFRERILLVITKTGTDKSTQLPQYAAERCTNGLVVCTQSRASTAMILARQVADEYDGTKEGNSVGFQVGYNTDRSSDYVKGSEIMFMTDAALIHEFQRDPNLSRIGVLVIDDIHERSLNTDIVMSIAKLLLNNRADDFFVVLASIAIDPKPFLKFFDRSSKSPLYIADQLHSVTVENLPPPIDCPDYKFLEVHLIPILLRFYAKTRGHTLVFFPSQREIEKALQLFQRNLPDDCIALSLYGSLSFEEQDKILHFDDHHSNKRMVVFCTNIAETSFTIKNVQLVIDTGLIRQYRFDQKYQMNISETIRIARCAADIRRNLAGHIKRGYCIRLYNDDELKEDHIEPEILRSSLDLVLLQLKCLHLDIGTFPLINKPDSAAVRHSIDHLQKLMCLNNKKEITLLGQLFAELSLSPRLSAFMVNVHIEQKDSQRLLLLVATLTAILSAPGSFFSLNETSNSSSHDITMNDDDYNSDLLYLAKIFNEWKSTGIINRTTNKCNTCHRSITSQSDFCLKCRTQHCFMHGLNYQILQSIENSIEFYIKTITDARWKLKASSNITNKLSNDGEIIGEHLRRLFPTQLGHLLLPHLPDEGIRLIESNLRASIANKSIYVQRAHKPANQFFVAMSITRLASGRYIVDRLHQVLPDTLPRFSLEQLLIRDNIGWAISNEVQTQFNSIRSEAWTKWLVHEYDQSLRRLIIWGPSKERSYVESLLQPILSNTHTKTIECGPIRATFANGLICTSVEITENPLRIILQRVPCKTYDKLQIWLKKVLKISSHDIRENNFQEQFSRSANSDDESDEDNDYQAPPFYIVLKSMETFQRATANLPAHHMCSEATLSSSTTGTHMSEKDAWGRQLVLTVPPDSTYTTAKELLDRLLPHAVDCRQFGKRSSIRAQPGIEITNLASDTDETFLQQILQPIHPLKISVRQTHRDGTGSASAHIFFANNQQRQQIITNLQADFCQKPITITVRSRTTHQLVEKQILPTITELKGKDPIALTFLITAINRESARHLYKDIIPQIDSSWKIDSSATVTVTHPHLYPDFDQLLQQITQKFKVQVEQQPIDQKQINGRGPVRCYFKQGTPQKTALAASMLAQSTAPILIKITNERQKQLFDELFLFGKITEWSKKYKLEIIQKKQDKLIEIRGPQIQQGQLMRDIGDYSDTFDQRFRILELNSTIANFFGRKKLADKQLETISEKWTNWGCHVSYISKTKSILIYAQPTNQLSFLDACENEVKQFLSKLSVDGNITRDKQKCVFCGNMSYSTNTLRLCGHAYCRCASTHLANTFPLQCQESTCQMNIDIYDLYEIFEDRQERLRLCKKSIQIYLEKHSSTYDQRFCPNPTCDGLVRKSLAYQTCITCGKLVCPSCAVIDDDSHQERTCAERDMFQKMGDFLPNLFKAAEKFARDNWLPQTPPIIRVDYNVALASPCASMKRFHKGIQALGQPLPPDMARGFFAFHGTAATAIKPICTEGFDPKRRAGQAYGPGEYFGVSSAVSHGYCRPTNPQGPFAMIIGFLLNCPQLSTRPGFCHVMNNPVDWSHAFNVPVVVVSYGTQSTCESPLN